MTPKGWLQMSSRLMTRAEDPASDRREGLTGLAHRSQLESLVQAPGKGWGETLGILGSSSCPLCVHRGRFVRCGGC
jgi:hypothetical protein